MKRFKTNKNEFDELLSEYRASYYFSFLSMFFLLTVVLGLLAFYATSVTYLEVTEEAVLDFVDDIDVKENGEELTVDLYPDDPRMVVAYAYLDSKNKLNYMIKGSISFETQEDYMLFWRAANAQTNYEQFIHEEPRCKVIFIWCMLKN